MIKFEELLEGVFDEGTEEYDIIKEGYEVIIKSAPTLSGEAKTQMILLDHCRSKLSTLYYLVSKKINKYRKEYQKAYDLGYIRLVKLGRPSHAAIDAELRCTCSEYAKVYDKITQLEQVKDLINSYIRCIDNNKQTAIEILRDSRRID